MARAPLPDRISIGTFFVLRWDVDAERMFLWVDDAAHSSYDMGCHLSAVVDQLVLWGVPKLFAARAVDAAREFRAVQVIPTQDRVINLLPRTSQANPVAEQLAAMDELNLNTYVHP